MRLKYKITLGAILLAAVPVLIASLVTNSIATGKSHDALEEAARERLVAVRDLTKGRIEDYFGTIRKQIRTLSKNHMVIEAMSDFEFGFRRYPVDMGYSETDISSQKSQLASYYTGDFSPEYQKRNQNQQANVNQWLSQLGNSAVALQQTFINTNPNPLGEKDKLTEIPGGSMYAKYHKLYHPVFQNYLEEFEFYDIFLVDAKSENIVYSVFKELDYATSLKDGAFANSGIGEVFRKAKQAASGEVVALSDFAAYPPSYQDPASFIASPIYKGDKMTGVLIFQMPIGQINNVMTHGQAWKEAGLGASGETYLVGADSTLRSQSRFLLEDKAGYLKVLRESGVAEKTVNAIASKETSISLQPADTDGTRAALSGETGFKIFPDYRNVPVLSAYAPIKLDGVNWAIMAEIDEEEAFAAADALSSQLMLAALGVAGVLILLASGVGFWLAGSLSRPILKLANTIAEIEQDADLTRTVNIHSKDELGETATAFNAMLEKFRSSMQQVSDSTSQLATTAEETSVITEQTNQAIQSQLSESTQVATAMNEMSATVQEVATTTSSTSLAANEVNSQATEGQQAMNETISQIQQLSEKVECAGEVIQQLEQHSVEIGGVLDVIKGIAEQTNLLALNAAIEAARAGEQGRGFAVVADEVRNLASKTQASTEEINQMIEKLQSGSAQAVDAVNSSQEMARCAVEQASKTGDALSGISEAIQRVNDMSTQIASAAEEQSAVAEEINRNIVQINDMTEQTAIGAKQTSVAGGDLTRLASDLQGLVLQFKV